MKIDAICTTLLTTSCCGLSVKSVYHLVVTADEFPARPDVKGPLTALLEGTFATLGIVAECATQFGRCISAGNYLQIRQQKMA